MRKMFAVLFGLLSIVYMTGCGGSSSTTVPPKNETFPSPYGSYSTVVGGRYQKGALAFTKYSTSTFSGTSAGFGNYSTNSLPALFNHPLAVTSDGKNLYVADYSNSAIRKIVVSPDSGSRFVTTIATKNADGTAFGLNLPSGITTYGTDLYVTDSGSFRVLKIDSGGIVTVLAGSAGAAGSVDAEIGSNARFNSLNGIATDGTSLYVTDSNNTIRRIALSGTLPVTTLAGVPGTAGADDSALNNPFSARFNQPVCLATVGQYLYVTDFGNSLIRKIDLSTGMVTTIAGVSGPGGATGQDVDAETGQTAHFNQPYGITTDGINLYVTDAYANTIRQIVLTISGYSGKVSTIGGAASGFNGGSTDGVKEVSTFNAPSGITHDGIDLFVTDSMNNRIRKIQN